MDSKGMTSKKRKPDMPKTTGAMTSQGKRKMPLKEKPKIMPELLNPSQISNPFEGNWKKHCFAINCFSYERVSAGPDPDSEEDERFVQWYMASKFTDCCTLVKGGKICISSSEFEAFVPPTTAAECCFESSWVAVHGSDSICVVTYRKALDLSNPSAAFRLYLTETENMELFSQAVIFQVEGIQYKDFGCNDEILRGNVVKPFAVVSLVLDTERSCDEAKDPVSNFLYQRMRNSGLAFTDYETIQTAIGAFQHMCRGQELSAEDIWVTSMDVSSGRFDHLDIDMIKQQLDIVNNGNLSPTKSSLL